MLSMKTIRAKLVFLGAIYSVPVVMNIVGVGLLGFRY
jgi:hypothetical protein